MCHHFLFSLSQFVILRWWISRITLFYGYKPIPVGFPEFINVLSLSVAELNQLSREGVEEFAIYVPPIFFGYRRFLTGVPGLRQVRYQSRIELLKAIDCLSVDVGEAGFTQPFPTGTTAETVPGLLLKTREAIEVIGAAIQKLFGR
jgi:hypothetical protein